MIDRYDPQATTRILMGQPQPSRLASTNTRFLLVFGFLGTLVLSALTMGVAAVEITRVEQDILLVADESQQATYFLGDVGEQLARLRSHVALGLRETPAKFGERAATIAAIQSILDTALGEIPVHLEHGLVRDWGALQPEVRRLRQTYVDAADALRAGESWRASEILEQEAVAATAVHDSLDELLETHRDVVQTRLDAAHRRASLVRRLAAWLGGVFVTGLLAIWGSLVVLLGRQRRRLDEHAKRLEAINADLDAFAGRVAHDLKNALAPVQIAPALLRRAQDPNRVLDVADRLERCSRKAVAVLDALLAFSRASGTVDPGESAPLSVAVQSVLEELAPEIERLAVAVEVADLPQLRVRCSPGLLHIVLANLCGNAIKYLEGQPERRVRISAQRDGPQCRIDVEDTGPGIPKGAQQRIFEPFYRVEGTVAPGTGIGLATVRRVVEQRGGHITVTSVEGHGARFQVWLPVAAEVNAAVDAAPVDRIGRFGAALADAQASSRSEAPLRD